MDQDFDFPSSPPIKRKASKAAQNNPVAKTESAPVQEAPETPSTEPVAEAVTTPPKYSEDELAAIFDEIIFSGEYVEEMMIRGKLRVCFRTRTAEEVRHITQVVDSTQAVYASTVDSIRSLLQLQYALTSYQGKDLGCVKTEEKARFIGQIPGPIVALLLQSLAKFDEKVFLACQAGEANF